MTVAQVVAKTTPLELRAFGTVEPNASVDVKSQVSGELIGVHFDKGSEIKKGDLLFSIDARPAKSQRLVAQANLARDKVQYESARIEAERQEALFERQLASEEQLAKARTVAAALGATLSADEAAVQSASLSVKYSEIRSPIDGRTGDLLVNQGNLVTANGAVLVTIKQIRPIRVAFSLPQKELPVVMRRLSASENGGVLEVRAFIPGEEGDPEKGRVALVDNAVDPSTGTIKLWAELANERSRLWPGQFVNVVVSLDTQIDAIVVPARAVQSGQNGAYVFVVGPGNIADQREIVVDRTFENEVIITQGLAVGERVVTDGQLRLRAGSALSISAAAKSGAANP